MAEEIKDEGKSSSKETPYVRKSLDEILGKKEPKKQEEQKAPDKKEEKPALKDIPDKQPAKKPDDKKQEKPEDKKPEKEEKKPDDKADDKKESKEKDEKPESGKDDKKTPDYEADDNPYKKRFKDTQSTWNKEHQQLLEQGRRMQELERQNTILQKKADGTWTDADEEAERVAPEDIAKASLQAGKTLASRTAAYDKWGKENVDHFLGEFHEAFGNNAIIQHIVKESESPVFEALQILNRHRFEKKYGDTPEKIYDAIKKEVTEQLTPELRKQIAKELMDGADEKDNTPSNMSSRGSTESSKGNKTPPKKKSLKQIFGR